jgi:hypothetical protein
MMDECIYRGEGNNSIVLAHFAVGWSDSYHAHLRVDVFDACDKLLRGMALPNIAFLQNLIQTAFNLMVLQLGIGVG